MWSSIIILIQLLFVCLSSAANLPPSLQLISNTHPLSNSSYHYIQCLPRSNVTYPIYDSPLELEMTFGHNPILSWQAATFLRNVLIAIKPNAASHPYEYIPDGYYYYHEPRQLGALSVIPSLFKNFTWSDLYLVLHGLADYIVKAPHAHEMCVLINFRKGGLAGVIFFDWWTSDVPMRQQSIRVRDAGHRRLLKSDK